MVPMSHECNKYIISNRKFVRDFETMYQKVEDPWGQRACHVNDTVNNGALTFLTNLYSRWQKQPQSILDVGCADGYFAESLLSLSASSCASYVGTDISSTVIQKAHEFTAASETKPQMKFLVDDIRVLNKGFVRRFDAIFSAKTLYYVAPEIDDVLENLDQYLQPGGVLCFTYNQTPNAFTTRWLTYELLREKLLSRSFSEQLLVEINRFQQEVFVIGVFKK